MGGTDNCDSYYLNGKVNNFRGGILGYTVFKRTYAARKADGTGSETESFHDCVNRMMSSDLITNGCQFSHSDQAMLQHYLMQQKCSLSGRYLQSLGFILDSGFLPLSSCAFTKVSDPVRPFCYAAHLSLLGVGVVK